MQKDLTTFVFNGVSFRIAMFDGTPWFVAKDIANVLGYANPSKAIKDHVSMQDRLMNATFTSLGQRGGWFINESGLYALILRSKMPTADAFKQWVTSEVLPSIRRNGMYITDSKLEQLLADPDTMIGVLQAYKAEKERRLQAEKERVWISNKREAQAMNTASQLAKKVKQLENKLGEGNLYKTVGNRAELKWFFPNMTPVEASKIGKALSKICREYGWETKEIPGPKYSTRAYPIGAFELYESSLRTK